MRERCDWDAFEHWAEFVAASERTAPRRSPRSPAFRPQTIREAARLYATGGNGAIYYGLGVTEHSQGSTTVMAIANLAMATGNIGRPGVGVNPLRGQNNVQGSCDMGSFPHELSGYRHISIDCRAQLFEDDWGVTLDKEPGLRIPNMLDAAVDGAFKGIYIQGEDILQSDPDTKHVAAGLAAMECVVVQDLFLNETAQFAHVFLPGSTFLEKDGTFINAERRIQLVRKVMAPKNGYEDWEITCLHHQRPGLSDALRPSVGDHGRDRAADADLRRRVVQACSRSWARCSGRATTRRPRARRSCTSASFVRGKGRFMITEYVATDEKVGAALPAAADHRPHPVAIQRRRADPPHRQRHLARGGSARNPSARRRGARHPRRRLGQACEPRRRDDPARADHRAGGAGRRLHHVPPSRHAGQRGHHRLFRLGDQLPGIQGDGGAGFAVERSVAMAGGLRQSARQSRRIAPPEAAE